MLSNKPIMNETIDRYGERTVCRVESVDENNNGLELILRIMGEFRNVDRDEVVLLLERIIQALYGNKTELKGNIRTVSQGKTKKIVKLVPFDKDRKKTIRTIVESLHERLDLDGRREFKKELQKLLDSF